MPIPPEDYYGLLNIPRSATQEEIRRAYLHAAKRLHPDKNVAPGETELFLGVHQAYQVLSDPIRRSAYDATLPPEKPTTPIFTCQFLLSRNNLNHLTEKQRIYLLLKLIPTEEVKKITRHIPINLCLVVDTSTSMKGAKLDMVMQTTIQIINSLREQDFFSVVAFNDRANVIIPATRNKNPQTMISALRHIQTLGGTEIYKGLKLALQEVTRYSQSEAINHIILLTDGRTYGDEQFCYDLAKEAARQNVSIIGLGIGNGWNDIFLDHITSLTGGYCIMVSQPNEIEELLKNKFFQLSNTLAPNINLSFETVPNIEMSYIFRIQPEASPIIDENPIRLGAMLMDMPLKILIECIIQPQENNAPAITILNGLLHISAAGSISSAMSIPLQIRIPVNPTSEIESPPQEIIQALSKLTLYRLQEKARNEVADGNYNKATEHLQQLATHLLAHGETTLAKNILAEKKYIEQQNNFSEGGEKSIKFGTRALFLPTEERK